MQYLAAVLALLWSTSALAEDYNVSLAGLTLRQGERIVRISIKIDGGVVKAITAIPPDWSVELSPAAFTALEMRAVHGVAFLDDMADFNRFLIVSPYAPGDPVKVTGRIAIYMTDTDKERVVELNNLQIKLERPVD